MTKFKAGDHAILARGECVEVYPHHKNKEVIITDNSAVPHFHTVDDTHYCFTSENHLDPINTEETNMYEVGQTLVDEAGDEKTVLGVTGNLVALSCWGDPDTMESWYTLKEMEDFDFKLKGSEPELKEVTLDEVAEAMGVPVESLRIKKED